MSVQPCDLLQYLAEFKVIVCTSCRYALQPNAISRHLKDLHHILRSARKPFEQYVSTLDLNTPETVIQSTDDLKAFPVPLLPVQDGLKCSHQGCSQMCVTEKRMKRHWAIEHGQPGRPGVDWSSVPLQTFFRGNSLRYFTDPHCPAVRKPLYHDHDIALLQHYIAFTSRTLADGIEITHKDLTVCIVSSLSAQKLTGLKFLTSPGPFTDLSTSTSSVPNSSRKPQGALITIWQEVIPKLAKTNTFLMHGILACSAYHQAYLNPSRRQSFLITAATHQELAMPLFRGALANLDVENCHAVLAFVHILGLCSFAAEPENERLLLVNFDGPELVSDWLLFMRSGCHYIEVIRDFVEDGPLTALLCEWVKPMDVYDGPQSPTVERLLGFIPSQNCEDAWSARECQIYRDAVHLLGYAFVCAEGLGRHFNTWDALRVWPVLLSVDYFQLLRDLHPGALVLLSYYCLLLRKLNGKWYLEGKAERLLTYIIQRLDSKWHSLVPWAME